MYDRLLNNKRKKGGNKKKKKMLFLSFFRREFLFFQLRAYPLDRPQPFREQPKKRKLQHNFFSRGKYIPPNVFLSLFFCCSKKKKENHHLLFSV
jgi:hypothetical protein